MRSCNPTEGARLEAEQSRRVRLRHGGYERRSAERYEDRLPVEAKDVQRAAVADWLTRLHRPGERMRILSLPDRYWTFENRMNDRPKTSFVGLQRDWTTLELSVPWMPLPGNIPPWSTDRVASPFLAGAATGEVQGYQKGANVIFHMWAGHLLAWENFGARRNPAVSLRSKAIRRVTAAWLDFTGYLTDEVIAATAGIPTFLGGAGVRDVFPVVTTFLACRDEFRSHEDRVTRLLIGLQANQRPGKGWRFRFDRFEVHVGTSPFISVFGTYHFKEGPATDGPARQGVADA